MRNYQCMGSTRDSQGKYTILSPTMHGITHMHTFVNIYTCTCKYINRSTVAYIYIYINAHTCLLIQCMGSTRDTQEKVFKICLILSVCTNSTTIL